MGDIADDLIQAQIMFPDMDPTDAYNAYLMELAEEGIQMDKEEKFPPPLQKLIDEGSLTADELNEGLKEVMGAAEISPRDEPQKPSGIEGFWKFKIGYLFTFADEEIISRAFKVAADAHKEAFMIYPETVVAPYFRINIHFDYPLSNSAVFEFEANTPEGFTRFAFYRAVREGYERIYAAEEDPGVVGGGCVNRSQSEGPCGIWGHYIGDLCIEGVVQVAKAEYKLLMGS